MNFCSHCGSNRLLLHIPKGDNRPRYQCQDCESIFYSNPKIILGCLPIYKGKILLARRAIEPRYGKWNLPAGFMENGETVEQGALRELKEETGLEGRIVELFSVYSVLHAHQVYLIFLVELLNDAFENTAETLENRLFRPEEIPWKEIAFSSNTFCLQRYLDEGRQNSPYFGELDLAF